MRVIVDRERARTLFDTLVAAFEARAYPYALKDAQVPHIPENLPRGGFRDECSRAGYFFALCYYMRGGIRSDYAAKRLSRVYDLEPRIFLPEAGSKTPVEFLQWILKGVGLGYNLKKISQLWIENSERVVDFLGGDFRNIFKDVESNEAAGERIKNKESARRRAPGSYPGFLGFQEKMVSMLIYFFMDAGFIDPWHFPVPVDFHVLRVFFAHEVLRVEEYDNRNFYKPEVLAAARELTKSYAREHDLDPLRLSEVFWCLSRSICERHPGNTSSGGRIRRGRKTILTPGVVDWRFSQQRAYHSACASCPVEGTCNWNIPSSPYYIQGKLVVRGRRERSPQLHISD